MQWTYSGGHSISNLEELRALIEQYDAWGLSLPEFQQRAGYHSDGDAEYSITFSWGNRNTSLEESWELIQYIHKYYQSK
ncbi:hypothetical protein SAMN00790413_05221 [Deinococcus hopiensis KR-140]|uniref:Uncharacterized protein n=1 Tax=Deinococcus hopiensis KR-140 TaxID=695939 RepID=A0A1W1UUC4_9DEIO|nr:hypothetical protein SAMN00790413_05221 [Deinococcus hopiensis KR-140]